MSDEQKVLNAVLNMTKAFHNQDIDGVMAAYAPGAVVCFEPGKPVGDRGEIEQSFRGFFTINPNFTYAGHQVVVAGDTAVHIAPWQMEGTGPDGGAVNMRGLSVAVLQRQADGRWLLVVDNPYGNQAEASDQN